MAPKRNSGRGAESAVPYFRAVRHRHGRIVAVMTHYTDVSDAFISARVDDFWGSSAWSVWASQIRKVFPDAEYPIVDFYKFAANGYAFGIDIVLYALTH